MMEEYEISVIEIYCSQTEHLHMLLSTLCSKYEVQRSNLDILIIV